MPIETPGQDHPARSDARLQGIAGQVRHVEIDEVRSRAHIVRVQNHRHAKLGRGGKERIESAIVERSLLDGRTDLNATQAELEDRPAQFGHCRLRLLQGDSCHSVQSVGESGERGDGVVRQPAEVSGCGCVEPVKKQCRRQREHRAVNTQAVHLTESGLEIEELW